MKDCVEKRLNGFEKMTSAIIVPEKLDARA